MLPPLVASSRHAYVGQSGAGKSHAAKLAVMAYLKTPGARVVVVDPLDEWSKLGKHNAHVTLGPCTHRATAGEVFDDPSRWLDGDSVALAVVVSGDEDEASRQVAELCDLVLSTGDMLMVLEECGAFTGPDVSDQCAKKALAKLATRGRHFGVPSLYCAQRLVQVPPSARAQLDAAAVFRQVHPADLAALDEFAAATGALVGGKRISGRELREVVQQLPDRECAEWTARGNNKGQAK